MCSHLICEPLTYAINLSFSEGKFPTTLKATTVIPLHKKGERESIENYRPVNILPIFAKVYEHLMNKKLINFLSKHKIINSHQHGFIEGRNTDSALFDLLSHAYEALDNREHVFGLFIDLSKAFDCINHEILLHKLNLIGVRGVANEWFASYLRDRSQRVRCHDMISSKLEVSMGIPQGSSLSPTLFVIFINDLASCLEEGEAHMVNYADDINVVIKNKTLRESVNNVRKVYEKIDRWMTDNRLLINETKTSCVLFQSGRAIPMEDIILNNNNKITSIQSTPVLGLIVDCQLKWMEHISKLCQKLGRVCYAIRTLKRTCNINCLQTFYHSNFLSCMRFGIVHWGASTHVERIFLMQKRALRIIYGLKAKETCKGILKEHNLLTFYDIYIMEVVCFVFKHMNTFARNNISHGVNTRQEHYMLPARHTTALYQRSLYYRGCLFYNRLPSNIRESKNLHLFKTEVQRYMLKLNCYSVQDFLNVQQMNSLLEL